MIVVTHVAASYLLAKAAEIATQTTFTRREIAVVLISSMVLDIDYLIAALFGKKGEYHHNLITHTPFGALIVWGALALIVSDLVRPIVLLVMLASLLLHLFMDDLAYYFGRLGFQHGSEHPQINWLYPFTNFADKDTIRKTILRYCLLNRASLALEVLIVVGGAVLALKAI